MRDATESPPLEPLTGYDVPAGCRDELLDEHGAPRPHAASLIATLNAERFYAAAGFLSQERIKWKHPLGFELDCVPMHKKLVR